MSDTEQSVHEPCPFCGCKQLTMVGGHEIACQVMCNNCHAWGPLVSTTRLAWNALDDKNAWAAWDRRSK